MNIPLQEVVRYLAGREGRAAGALRAELADPSSEASRFLESARLRSRALFEDPLAAEAAPPRPVAARFRPGRAAWIAGLAASTLLAAVGALGLGEARLRRLEGTIARRDAESRADARRLELALARVVVAPPPAARPPSAVPNPRPGPVEQALARVESGLGKLERRIDGLDRPAAEPPGPGTPTAPEPDPIGTDPTIVEIRRELAELRRQLTASDQAGARQVGEIRMALQDLGNLVRLSLSRPAVLVPAPNGNQNFANAQPDGATAQLMGLVANLANPHHQARLEAVQQLGRMGPAAQAALPSLQQMLGHEPDARVRAAAQAAIGAIQQ